MAEKFRDKQPKRTFTKAYANYGSYKPYIAVDFNKRCGYTDCSDFWFGGSNNFHIDHFKPWRKNPHLKTIYSNLIYCCSYVNILKSDDEGDYLDPCNIDYNDHFERNSIGTIVPKSTSKEAHYMYKHLKLYMKRYQIIWMLDHLYAQMKKLKEIINIEKDSDLKNNLLISQGELSNLFVEYLEYLEVNQ